MKSVCHGKPGHERPLARVAHATDVPRSTMPLQHPRIRRFRQPSRRGYHDQEAFRPGWRRDRRPADELGRGGSRRRSVPKAWNNTWSDVVRLAKMLSSSETVPAWEAPTRHACTSRRRDGSRRTVRAGPLSPPRMCFQGHRHATFHEDDEKPARRGRRRRLHLPRPLHIQKPIWPACTRLLLSRVGCRSSADTHRRSRCYHPW